jgi:hypothetical protein
VIENKEQIISRFNMAGLPSLPELLLCEMDALLQPVSPDLADGGLQ